MWTTLNFASRSKTRKKQVGDNCEGALDIECERNWSVGSGATLCDAAERKSKTIFVVSGIFSGKVDSVILLGFECTINPQNLIKIVGAIFEKIKIFNFFLIWTTLTFRGREKLKNVCVCVCVYLSVWLTVTDHRAKPIDRSRSNSISRVLL